jgi:hypothetical protein
VAAAGSHSTKPTGNVEKRGKNSDTAHFTIDSYHDSIVYTLNMTSVKPNYFTCTLGQAAQLKSQNGSAEWKTVLELIDHQAQNIPDSPALGFATFKHLKSSQGFRSRILIHSDISLT